MKANKYYTESRLSRITRRAFYLIYKTLYNTGWAIAPRRWRRALQLPGITRKSLFAKRLTDLFSADVSTVRQRSASVICRIRSASGGYRGVRDICG